MPSRTSRARSGRADGRRRPGGDETPFGGSEASGSARPAGIERRGLLAEVVAACRTVPTDGPGEERSNEEGEGTGDTFADAPLILVAFTARWCLPWRLLRRQLDDQPLASELVEVDVDTHPQLADRWGADVLPTVVRCEHGVETKRWVGALSVSELAAGEALGAPASRGMRRRR